MPESTPPADPTESKDPQQPKPAATSAAANEQEFVLLVRCQDALERPETRRSQELAVRCSPKTSVLSALQLARETQHDKSQDVAFEGDCFEGVCGACAMLVNGRVRLACGTLLAEAADKQGRVRLAPMKHFPLVRDLVVDRSRISRTLSTVPVAGPPSPTASVNTATPTATRALELADLDQCHQCGACLEACPQYGVHSEFVGALTLHEVHLRNSMASGEHGRQNRIEAMMGPGGINSCGKAQNCVEVCPAALPLVDSIQSVARATSKQLLFGWLLG